MQSRFFIAAVAGALALTAASAALARDADPGASDTEIKIGNIEAYSGPASAYGVIGKTEEPSFKWINDQGGINGRKINFISYDDGYSPPRRSNRRASWSRAMRFCCFSIRWELRPISALSST